MRNSVKILILSLISLSLFSCTDNPPTGGGGDIDPDAPSAPNAVTPANRENGQETDLVLVWQQSVDPNGDPVTYTLYFGPTDPPPKMADNLTDTSYVVSGLQTGKRYYWKVEASDASGHVNSSRVSTFATTDDYRFPLAVGNRWGYETEIRYVGLDTSEPTAPDTLYVGNASMQIVGDTVFEDTIPILIVQQEDEMGGLTEEATLYVRNAAEGRLTYAYSGGSLITPGKIARSQSISFRGNQFESMDHLVAMLGDWIPYAPRANGALYMEQPPLVALKYPLVVGQRWNYRSGLDTPFRIDKRVEGTEFLETAAGKFEVYVVRWLYDFDQDGLFADSVWIEDRIAAEGLVRREIVIQGIAQTGGYDNSLDTIGLFDTYQRYELVQFSVE